jgi:CheY-like chemotaxis protein
MLINDLLNMLRRLLGENIEVTFQAGAGSHWVSADAGMIQQVVMNLCINARDAMPNGGRLSLATSEVEIGAPSEESHPDARPGHFVCLSVTDIGCGMDEAVLRKIFEPFFTTKEVGKGTGLGLAIVYGIVKQHQGWIEVESKPGHGSSFRVYLPATSLFSAFGTPGDEEQVRGGSETILLVEDEVFLRQLTALWLRKLGYVVLEAGNGAEALKVWEENHPRIQLLFTDMKMPGQMTGLDLAVRLKNEKGSLKVISSSGYSADLGDSPLAAGQDITYLPKPYTPPELAKTVRHCLDEA